MDLLLHCISFSVSIPSFVAVLPALVTFPYNVLSLMLFLTPIFCFESCYLVFVDVIVLCWLLIRISLLFSILLFLKFLLLCYGLVRKDIKLVSKSIVKFCTTTLIDCLPFATYWNIPPYSIQIGMESHLASYLIGVTDEEAEIKEPIWVYPEDLEEDDEGDFIPEEDVLLFPEDFDMESDSHKPMQSFTAYKRVDRKVKPVPGIFPEDARVIRQFPEDPLLSLPYLSPNPPTFKPTTKFTQERMEALKINSTGFLSLEEEKLIQHVMTLNEEALCFEEAERGTFKESYFSPYIIPTIPHIPWEYRNIPIPPGIRDKVIEVFKNKISAGVYESCQSAYRS